MSVRSIIRTRISRPTTCYINNSTTIRLFRYLLVQIKDMTVCTTRDSPPPLMSHRQAFFWTQQSHHTSLHHSPYRPQQTPCHLYPPSTHRRLHRPRHPFLVGLPWYNPVTKH